MHASMSCAAPVAARAGWPGPCARRPVAELIGRHHRVPGRHSAWPQLATYQLRSVRLPSSPCSTTYTRTIQQRTPFSIFIVLDRSHGMQFHPRRRHACMTSSPLLQYCSTVGPGEEQLAVHRSSACSHSMQAQPGECQRPNIGHRISLQVSSNLV